MTEEKLKPNRDEEKRKIPYGDITEKNLDIEFHTNEIEISKPVSPGPTTLIKDIDAASFAHRLYIPSITPINDDTAKESKIYYSVLVNEKLFKGKTNNLYKYVFGIEAIISDDFEKLLEKFNDLTLDDWHASGKRNVINMTDFYILKDSGKTWEKFDFSYEEKLDMIERHNCEYNKKEKQKWCCSGHYTYYLQDLEEYASKERKLPENEQWFDEKEIKKYCGVYKYQSNEAGTPNRKTTINVHISTLKCYNNKEKFLKENKWFLKPKNKIEEIPYQEIEEWKKENEKPEIESYVKKYEFL